MYYIKFNFNISSNNKNKNLKNEQIDYRNISNIENIIKDQVVAEVFSEDAIQELDNQENIIKISNPKDIENFIGEGVYINTNQPSRLYADKNGAAFLKNNKIYIEDKLYFDEISYKTGNITFVGDIFIKHDVKPGFVINARNITIDGSVDNSKLIAGESVIIKGGVIGSQKTNSSYIKAGKLVALNFIENTIVECHNGPVYIKKSSMHSSIYAKGRIAVYGSPGLVVGGEIMAQDTLLINIAGSKWGTETILKVGIDPFKYLRLKNYENDLNNKLSLFEDTNKSIEYIESVLENSSESGEKRESLINELEDIKIKRDNFNKKINKLQSIISTTKLLIEEEKQNLHLKDTKICIYNKIFPGTEIRLGLNHHRIYDDMEGHIFQLNENGEVTFNKLTN